MSVAMMRRMRTGMGAWDDFELGYPSVTGQYPESDNGNSGNGAPPWWAILGPSIITTAGTVTRDVFAPVGSTQAAYGAQYRTQQRQLTTEEILALSRQSNTGAGIGEGLERFVRENSTLLLIGAGLLVLIQMPGFTRRGR